MSLLWYPSVKESPIKGLSGMGGGIFWSSMQGGGIADAEVVVVASTQNNTSPSPAGTYTDGQSFYLRGYDVTVNEKSPYSTSFRNNGYMQVGADSQLLVRIWGAAGGSGNTSFQGYGGGGQYVESTIVFDSDGGTVYYMVGCGGGWGDGTKIASGGWGGGGSCGKETGSTPSYGTSGVAWQNGGNATNFPVNRSAQGGGGGGVSGLFVKSGGAGQTADQNDASQANALILAGAGGGFGGYSPGQTGAGGGSADGNHPNSANATAAGVNNTSDAENGGAGYGGSGLQRGGGGGSGYWGGAGGNDQVYGGQPGTRQAGGGGYGNTTAGTSVSGVTISSTTITAATSASVANNGGTGYTSTPISYGTSGGNQQNMGGSGLIQITVQNQS